MVLKEFRKPDLNAPRFRPKKLNILNQDLYQKFIRDTPKYRYLSYDKFKNIITTMNGMIYQTVIDKRDGVELPEQLGYIFIGTCPRKVTSLGFFKLTWAETTHKPVLACSLFQ